MQILSSSHVKLVEYHPHCNDQINRYEQRLIARAWTNEQTLAARAMTLHEWAPASLALIYPPIYQRLQHADMWDIMIVAVLPGSIRCGPKSFDAHRRMMHFKRRWKLDIKRSDA